MNYKAVLFDWEGVVGAADVPRSFGWLTKRLHRDYGVKMETAEETLFAQVGEFASGKIDNTTFWQRVGEALGIDFSTEFQETIWSHWPSAEALPEMRELVAYVKQRGLKAIVLSNILPPSAEQIRRHGGYDMFDAEVLSYAEATRKPDIRMYQKAIELAGCSPEECIFVEDQERYLTPAIEMGITPILAKSPEQVIRDLKQLIP